MQSNELTKWFLIIFLAMIAKAFFNILSPYFSSILWSLILAIIFYPLNYRIQLIINDRNSIAAFLTIVIICLIVFVPLTIIITSLTTELNMIYKKLQYNNTYFLEEISWLFSHLPEWSKFFILDHHLNETSQMQKKISEIVLKIGQYLAGSVFLVGKNTFSFAIDFFIMLYLLFFFLKDGTALLNQIQDSLPLLTFEKQHLFSKFSTIVKSTVKGTIVIACIQGALGGIAFYINDIDDSILWGTIMAIFSLVPIVGLSIIWMPTSLYYLFITNQIEKGIVIIIFFVVIIGFVDNFLRPFLVRKDTKMPNYLVLITTLGGIKMYGINGFVVGPLISALFITCWNILYSRKLFQK